MFSCALDKQVKCWDLEQNKVGWLVSLTTAQEIAEKGVTVICAWYTERPMQGCMACLFQSPTPISNLSLQLPHHLRCRSSGTTMGTCRVFIAWHSTQHWIF